MRNTRHLSALLFLSAALAAAPVAAADLATHLFPSKDGEADPNNGGNRDSILRVGRSGSLGWITYQSGGADLSLTSGSALTLYVDRVISSGTLKLFALTSAVSVAEMDVEDTDLGFNDMSPVATIALSSADDGKVIRLDLDNLLSGGPFYGLVLGAASGLEADFGSKDSHLQPLIELQYAFASQAAIDSAIAAGTDAAAAATAADASATAAAASATAAAGSASAASTSATAAAGSAAAASTSETAATSSASAASTSATAAAGSATTATIKAAACSTSAVTSHNWADSSSARMSIPGQIIMTTSNTPPGGFTYTDIRRVLEKPWVTKTSSSVARYAVASAVYNNRLYVFGGYNGSYLTTMEYFDPSTNTWTSRASSTTATHYHAMAEMSGIIYSIGGQLSGGGPTAVTTAYTVSSNAWSTKASLPVAKTWLSAVSTGSSIFAMGGSTSLAASGIVATNHVFNGTSWTAKASMLTARGSMALIYENGKIHALGGQLADGSISSLHEVYNVAGNSWSTATALPIPMNMPNAFYVDGKIYVICQDGLGFYQLDIATDSWVKLENAPTPRYAGGAGYINGSMYLTQGYNNSLGTIATVEAYPIPKSIFYHEKN
jgi:N-acetylneuraminic acid mutarotase